MRTARPTYTITDLIRELMGFDGSTKVVMTRVLAEEIIAELNRLYEIEDGYRFLNEQVEALATDKAKTQPPE